MIGPDVRASPTAEAQLDLPLRFGGLGLRLPGSGGGERRVAKLSSAACLRPFDSPLRPALQEVWLQARTKTPDLWDESLAPLDDAYNGNWLGPAQRDFARHRAQRDYDALLAGLDDGTPDGLIAKPGSGASPAKEPQLGWRRCPPPDAWCFRTAISGWPCGDGWASQTCLGAHPQ
jgi:hypothetical protein